MTGAPRRRLSRDERRDQLIAATVDVVGRLGFRAASAEAIAQQAEVSKGLLWHYFEDLDDLLATTGRRTLELLRTAVAEQVDLEGPVPELLRAAIAAAAALPRTHGAQLRALREIAGNLRDIAGGPQLGAAEYDGLYAAQAELLRRGQREGHIRADLDAHLLAVSYQGLVDSMLAHLDAAPHLDPASYAATVADLLLQGAAVQPAARARISSATRSGTSSGSQ